MFIESFLSVYCRGEKAERGAKALSTKVVLKGSSPLRWFRYHSRVEDLLEDWAPVGVLGHANEGAVRFRHRQYVTWFWGAIRNKLQKLSVSQTA